MDRAPLQDAGIAPHCATMPHSQGNRTHVRSSRSWFPPQPTRQIAPGLPEGSTSAFSRRINPDFFP